MNYARIILLFPLALIRLILLFFYSLFIAWTGWIWLRLFGFSRRLQNWTMGNWGRGCMFILGIRAQHNEIPETGNFILMPNHRSYLDIFIVARYTPSAFVAKAELKNWPLLKAGAAISNTVFVSRKELKSLIETMNKIKESIAQKIPVVVFPEGTTSKGPLTKPFKNGSFKIAADTRIPVIPMAIHFKDEKDSWIDDDTFVGHFFRQMGKPVTRVSLKFGTPVSDADYKILQQKTREQINSMLQKLILDTAN